MNNSVNGSTFQTIPLHSSSNTEDTLLQRNKHIGPSHDTSSTASLLPGFPSTSSNEMKERNKRIWRQIWCSPLMIFIYCWAVIFFSLFLYVGYQRAEIYRNMEGRVECGVDTYYYNWFLNRPIVLYFIFYKIRNVECCW